MHVMLQVLDEVITSGSLQLAQGLGLAPSGHNSPLHQTGFCQRCPSPRHVSLWTRGQNCLIGRRCSFSAFLDPKRRSVGISRRQEKRKRLDRLQSRCDDGQSKAQAAGPTNGHRCIHIMVASSLRLLCEGYSSSQLANKTCLKLVHDFLNAVHPIGAPEPCSNDQSSIQEHCSKCKPNIGLVQDADVHCARLTCSSTQSLSTPLVCPSKSLRDDVPVLNKGLSMWTAQWPGLSVRTDEQI